MYVSKRALRKLLEEPYRLGTRDRYTQDGIVFMARHLLENEKLILEVYESDKK